MRTPATRESVAGQRPEASTRSRDPVAVSRYGTGSSQATRPSARRKLAFAPAGATPTSSSAPAQAALAGPAKLYPVGGGGLAQPVSFSPAGRCAASHRAAELTGMFRRQDC